MNANKQAGWIACDYTSGDDLEHDRVRHGDVRETCEDAQADARAGGYDGVRYLHSDGYLYCDQQDDTA